MDIKLNFNLKRAHLSPGLGHHLANGDIKPRQTTTIASPTEKHVVGEELQLGHVVHLLHTMDLDSLESHIDSSYLQNWKT